MGNLYYQQSKGSGYMLKKICSFLRDYISNNVIFLNPQGESEEAIVKELISDIKSEWNQKEWESRKSK